MEKEFQKIKDAVINFENVPNLERKEVLKKVIDEYYDKFWRNRAKELSEEANLTSSQKRV